MSRPGIEVGIVRAGKIFIHGVPLCACCAGCLLLVLLLNLLQSAVKLAAPRVPGVCRALQGKQG